MSLRWTGFVVELRAGKNRNRCHCCPLNLPVNGHTLSRVGEIWKAGSAGVRRTFTFNLQVHVLRCACACVISALLAALCHPDRVTGMQQDLLQRNNVGSPIAVAH
jgi:hypothetical protein